MHDRYFFLADMLSVLYAARYRDRRFMPLLVVSASLMSYMPFITASARQTCGFWR
ncbi:MAG: hypothetical protein ACLUMK_12840 [Christensenellales bacterium]